MRATTRATTEVWQREGETFGPYVVHEVVGAGGMATVHRAAVRFEGGAGKSIALKRMRPELANDPLLIEAFVREAKLAHQLRHPHIVETFAHGVLDETFYMAMELVSGPTLAQVITQSRTAAGAVPLPIVVAILVHLCDALDYVHQFGIIHRDISPANVIISPTGVVKVIDFGIAKGIAARSETRAGIVKGKLGYVAPEYTFGKLDARADLFAVGVIGHELLTGEPLFEDPSKLATLHALREKPIHPPSRRNAHVSRDLDDIVITALQRDPSLRWQNAAAMRFALRALGTMAGRAQIRAWTEWAFAKEPRRDTQEFGKMIDALEVSTSDAAMVAEPPRAMPPPIPLPRAVTPPQPRAPTQHVAVAELAKAPSRELEPYRHRAPARIDTQLVARMHRGTSPLWLIVLALALGVVIALISLH